MGLDLIKLFIDVMSDKGEQMSDYTIATLYGEISFTGRYCPEIKSDSWHYYEKRNGTVIHFRKDHMVYVDGVHIEGLKPSSVNRSMTISTAAGYLEFFGVYRRELETDNWHVYQRNNGLCIFIRKEHFIYADGDTVESILASKPTIVDRKYLKCDCDKRRGGPHGGIQGYRYMTIDKHMGFTDEDWYDFNPVFCPWCGMQLRDLDTNGINREA